MKRWVSLVISGLLLISLAACGAGGENDPQRTGPDGSPGVSQEPLEDGSTVETQVPGDGQEALSQEEAEGSHILIAYFTWADNARPALTTHVENMEDYDIVFLRRTGKSPWRLFPARSSL